MYVDDVLSGADTVDLAREKVKQIDELLMAGGFVLQKWVSNREAVLADIENSRRAGAPIREFRVDSVTRALGLSWRPESDSFIVAPRFSMPFSDITKRTVLSRLAQIFDPLGWITPVTLVPKMLLQEFWRLKLGWAEPLAEAQAARWVAYEHELTAITIEIPRRLGISSSALVVELHGFSDASRHAVRAVLYLRVIHDFNDIRISLVAAKSKVAPIKQTTIPRLELSAAVLLVRLTDQVRKAFRFESIPIHLWVDSSVALAWVASPPSRWREFVANRVAFIQDTLPSAKWHHVAGAENPADCASRGLSPTALAQYNLWWNGPSWLARPSPSWPSTVPPFNDRDDLEEKPKQSNLATTNRPVMWDLVERYSTLTRLIRITIWIMRAVARFRGRAAAQSSRVSTPSEHTEAELFWFRETQAAYFSGELHALRHGNILPRSHTFLRLAPFVDSRGLLRVGGRLRNSLLDPDAKHPILLPRDSPITRLLLEDVHVRTLHGGVQIMTAVLRRRVWILGGRSPVSYFVRRCVKCARYRAATATQLMGQLPSVRVTPSRSFLHTGVDYAGPFLLRTWRGRSSRLYKGFLVVFICLATSAVHLELATDYSTQGFSAAYRRFTGRRGIYVSLRSDCGTNFVGADAELRRLLENTSRELAEIAHILSSGGTEWRFNPPAALHFGGKWEAAVKSVKFHLRRLIGDATLTYEEFATLLTQIETILNSRPLCPLSDDPADLKALTPAHFLIGEPLSTVPEPSIADERTSRLSRWQFLQQISQRFWHRWAREYLQRLQGISKWRHSSERIRVGSMVLVTDNRLPPAKWPLGRVVQTHEGADGLVRVVTVRTATTTLKRPIVKLCPLPSDD